MRTPPLTVVDFESEAIQGRPDYPPRPVGVSIKRPGEPSRYLAWGHPVGNNTDKQKASAILRDIFKHDNILFHNAKFDVDVAVTHMGCPMPSWERIHDTLYLLFLNDPHAHTFSLKPSSERYLDMPPTEQEAVHEWLIDNGIVVRKDKKWGAHISKAPGLLVGRYAKGDTERTLKLFKLLYPKISDRGMLAAYNRERQLMPILLKNESEGIRVNYDLLARDIKKYDKAMVLIEAHLRRKLKAPHVDFNSTADVADILFKRDQVTEWTLTKTGKRSTAKKTLTKEKFKDQRLWLALGYRNKLAKCLSTYMKPWETVAAKSGGVTYLGWNQVRQSDDWGGDNFGARTGRPSTSPNMLAVTKSFYDRGDGYEHPKFVRDLPELPRCRHYIVPDKNEVFVHRDYNQQELRILAHYEDGDLQSSFRASPELDVHTFVQGKIAEICGTTYERRHVKTLNFGMLYGMGVKRLAAALGISVDTAKEMKRAQRRALPGLPELEATLKSIAKENGAIRTWGGREYYCEPPRQVEDEETGEMVTRTYEYKMLNYLIQGSAADATKEAIIRYDEAHKHGRFLVTVYDEINLSVPLQHVASEMKILKEAMESVKFDVPMITDGKVGKSWADMKKFND